MADMALGLAKKAVEGTVSRVLSAIDEDTKLKEVAQQDLRFIVDEFQMMQSFLKVAKDNKERTSNEVVKTWVRQLRELAFDVEDCVEFVIHLDTTSAQARWSWVWRVVPLPSCMAPAWTRDLDQAVAQLKQLKARVEELSQRNTRYNLLGGDDSGSSTTQLLVPPKQPDAAAFPSMVNILRDLWKANKKESSSFKYNLQYLVAHGLSDELRVISVWRSAGLDLEVAHIFNAVYQDQEIYKKFKAIARVKLIHPFDIQEFLKSLLKQLHLTSPQQDTLGADLHPPGRALDGGKQGSSPRPQESQDRHRLHLTDGDSVRQLLRKHKYLILIEDLSSMVQWNIIRSYLPDLHNGSRIIISTEELGFALWCMGEPSYRVLQLALFPNDRYIYAFYKLSGVYRTDLIKQLGENRVISLWGDMRSDMEDLVEGANEAGLKIDRFFDLQVRVNVPSPFNLEVFCRSIFRDYLTNSKSWGKELCEYRYLIVIEGLQYKMDWDLITQELVPKDTKSCIVVNANEEAVAQHCEDNSPRKIANNAEKPSSIGVIELVRQLGQCRAISLLGDEGGDTSCLVRFVYEAIKNKTPEFKGIKFEAFKWINAAPSALSLASRLGISWGKELVCECSYLIVLEGLRSKQDWDDLKNEGFMPEGTRSCFVIIANEEAVVQHCKDDAWRKIDDKEREEAYNAAIVDPLFEHNKLTELVRQLGHRRVISLWGHMGGGTSRLVRNVYKVIRNNNIALFSGVKFDYKKFMWIKVPSPFSLKGFCERMPWFRSRGYDDPERDVEFWSQRVSSSAFLIVIEGLQSKKDWDLIKDKGLVPEDTISCIVIIATTEAVAKHCEDNLWRKVDNEELREANIAAIIGPSFTQKPSGIGMTRFIRQLGRRRVISLWGDEDGDTSSLVRNVCNAIWIENIKFKGVNFEQVVWVNVPTPFCMESFCQYLSSYLDFSDFAEWRKLVCETRYLIVIEGLQSKEDWDSVIKDVLVPEDTISCIVIIANEEAVAQHCQDYSLRKKLEKQEEANKNQEEDNNASIMDPSLTQKEKYFRWDHNRFGSDGYSRRIKEATSQFKKFITQRQGELLAQINQCTTGVNAVWGATGVGKSALVRFFYYTVMAYSLDMINAADDHPMWDGRKIDPVRFDSFGWVDVAADEPFDLAEFSCRLLLDFNSKNHVKMEKTAVDIIQGHNPIGRCYETIHKQRCLVVIDGLRSTREWDSVKQAFLCDHHPKSCIYVITSDEIVAKHCVKNYKNGDRRTIPIRALDYNSASELFNKIASQCNKEWTDNYTEHAKRILPKCGGLPKIIDAVAKSGRSFWENINDDLVTKLKNDSQFGHLRGVLSWMHSYFDGCSDSVKPCIFYLSIFPTNCKIRKAHLLRRWIAEGYSRDTTSCSAKENAERLFDELVKLGIIQKVPGTPLCQMSGFFREYIISQPMEDNLVLALEGNCKPNSQRTVQHLSIMEDWEREKHVFQSIDVSRLRSLTVYGKWQSFFISDKMKRIRVLDLEGTSAVQDCCLEHIFEILLSLKFICLRGCESITCLPKTLGGLRQLESLDVSGTSIVTLPRAIIKLQKIQYIRAGRKFLPDEDCTSASSEVGGQKECVGCCCTSTISSQGSDDVVGSQQPSETKATPEAEGSDSGVVARSSPIQSLQGSDDAVGSPQPPGTTATPNAEGNDGGHQGQHQHHKQRYHRLKKVGRRCASRLSLRLSPLTPCSWFTDNNINGGVEVPVGIEDMPDLHTLGTVNISRGGGKYFLTMLKLKTTLPKLLKLSVCGINKENWKDLCDALSAHRHLESLSLVLDENCTEVSSFNNPPRALKSLDLYGHIHKLPAWTWLNKLEKFGLEVIISSQDEMNQLLKWLPAGGRVHRLFIKLTPKVSELEFKQDTKDIFPRVLKINCSSQLKVDFHEYSIARKVVELIIHCSKGSDFRISGSGLNHIEYLDTVWLKGEDEEAEYVDNLKGQIRAHPSIPDFKFEKLKSAKSLSRPTAGVPAT